MKWKGFKDIQATIEIDLAKKEKELWDSIDKNARWGINKAKKEGLKIKKSDEKKDIKKFYEIYKKTCKYGGIHPESLEKLNSKNIIYLLCYKKEKVIAGSALIIIDDKKIKQNLNASDHDYLKLQPNNLIYWHMILWGKENNYKILDLGGYQLGTKKGDKLYNVNKFKERWGGEIKKTPTYSYNPIYTVGRKAIRNSKIARKIWDKIKGRKNKK